MQNDFLNVAEISKRFTESEKQIVVDTTVAEYWSLVFNLALAQQLCMVSQKLGAVADSLDVLVKRGTAWGK